MDKREVFRVNEILTPADFQLVVTYLRNEGLETNDRALKAIAESERYLQQAYTGRYLFELIQNVRDANRQANVNGAVYIEIDENQISISNTGSPFSKKGIRSITTIGDSTKGSREFIGFKGIGFKSVQEISDLPSIVTRYGTIIFDRNLSWPALNNDLDTIEQVPLFFIPHYLEQSLSDAEIERELVTKIVLPLKANVDQTKIDGGFNNIQLHQLVLLGNLRYLEFRNGDQLKFFDIHDHRVTGKVTINSHDGPSYFKHYQPTVPVIIPEATIQQLDTKERTLFEKDPVAEISIVFDVSDNNRLEPIVNANLYLYYPLKLESGFKFLIHSCFIVNPERTELMDNKLNHFLLQQIGAYLAGEWLSLAKRNHKNTFLNYLAFKRNPTRPILTHLYQSLIDNLAGKNFIWDSNTGKFYKPETVVIGSGFERGLFEDNQLDGKPIIYIDNSDTVKWLTDELKITYLSYDTIKVHIEEECRRQLKKDNFPFFNNLYRYLVVHDQLNLRDCKILVTNQRQLMNRDAHVFYGMKAPRPHLSERIAKKIYFAHPNIKISDQRQGKWQTGFQEWSMELLVVRLLALYDENIPNEEILAVLISLDIKERLFPLIRAKIKLPLNNGHWVNPLESPAYLANEQLTALYPESKFIDASILNHLHLAPQIIQERLTNFGAWIIPAISFSKKTKRIHSGDPRYNILHGQRGYSTPYFELTGDWLIDFPDMPDQWFTETITLSWHQYAALIIHEESPIMEFRSQTSNEYDVAEERRVAVSGLVHTLRNFAWIKVPTSAELLKVDHVIGLDPIDYRSGTAILYKKYLHVLQLTYSSQQSAIRALDIRHFDTIDIGSWKEILNTIYQAHKELTFDGKEFTLFYNKVLNKLYDFFEYRLPEKSVIQQLKDAMFLSFDDQTGKYAWTPAHQVFYMDDKPGYDILPAEIKVVVQPHFINRDKNRFGKVAANIGLSFKQTIVQELIDTSYQQEKTFSAFFPNLAATLALTEQVLNITLHRDLERIKATHIFIKDQVNVRVKRNKQTIRELAVSHKVMGGRNNVVYTIQPPAVGRALFFARLLYDYLTELLGRDLQILQNLLTDYLGRSERESFLMTYNVDVERIQEINDFFADKLYTDFQLFWRDILLTKHISNNLAPFDEETTNFSILSQLLEIPAAKLTELERSINIKDLNQQANLEPLADLFGSLNLDLSVYNQLATHKIDFSNEYRRQFDGLKAKYKKTFEKRLYISLTDKPEHEQAEFQNMIDNYLSGFHSQIPEHLLIFDIGQHFKNRLAEAYPVLKVPKSTVEPQEIFTQNLALLVKQLTDLKLSQLLLDDFLNYNRHRSLLYFGKNRSLILFYRNWLSEYTTTFDDNGDDVEINEFVNLPGAAIETRDTSAVTVTDDLEDAQDSQGNGGGRRPDGGEQSPVKQLIGLVSEKMVYELLLEKYEQVEWVSKNAAKSKVNLEGHDRWGYDIHYTDEHNHLHFVEVKGKSNQQQHFYISYPEVKKAWKEKDHYHVVFVSDALQNDKRKIRDLGNIFMLNQLEDIFNNTKFTAKFNVLEIAFK